MGYHYDRFAHLEGRDRRTTVMTLHYIGRKAQQKDSDWYGLPDMSRL